MKNKHFTFDERYAIQTGLDAGKSIHKIAVEIDRVDSSVRREISRNRYRVSDRKYTVHPCHFRNSCERMHMCGDESCNRTCKGCYEVCNKPDCPDYEAAMCVHVSGAPFVCNGCPSLISQTCHFPKFSYNAKMAQQNYKDKLKESREGISISPEDMTELDNLVSPLLLNGHSISSVFIRHEDEIPVSERTLYSYVNDCRLTARNIDMPRKVHFKQRYKHDNSRNREPFAIGRTYKNYKDYMAENPEVSVCEIDTVIGTPGGKCLFTLIFQSCNLMIAILIDDKSQASIINAYNSICDAIGVELFSELFAVTLTDRGTEFSNPYALEHDSQGNEKTKVFYCDPYCSWQKPHVERNHEFIRQILPKGSSFDNLTQDDVTLMMNHINSYPRKSLNNHSPYEVAQMLLGETFLKAVNFSKIPADEVILKPSLIRKQSFQN